MTLAVQHVCRRPPFLAPVKPSTETLNGTGCCCGVGCSKCISSRIAEMVNSMSTRRLSLQRFGVNTGSSRAWLHLSLHASLLLLLLQFLPPCLRPFSTSSHQTWLFYEAGNAHPVPVTQSHTRVRPHHGTTKTCNAQELDEAEERLWDEEMQAAFKAADAARERFRQDAEVTVTRISASASEPHLQTLCVKTHNKAAKIILPKPTENRKQRTTAREQVRQDAEAQVQARRGAELGELPAEPITCSAEQR